jgi:hypothetical protein
VSEEKIGKLVAATVANRDDMLNGQRLSRHGIPTPTALVPIKIKELPSFGTLSLW